MFIISRCSSSSSFTDVVVCPHVADLLTDNRVVGLIRPHLGVHHPPWPSLVSTETHFERLGAATAIPSHGSSLSKPAQNITPCPPLRGIRSAFSTHGHHYVESGSDKLHNSRHRAIINQELTREETTTKRLKAGSRIWNS